MTITLSWWMVPLGLFILGVLLAVVSKWWDDAHSSGGYFGSLGNGCLGMLVCIGLWLAAIGICIGKWMS